ncbi:nucleic-acid-binding protein from transposon X-element [Trichonephila clavipes]|nr:nucleic-acid-binding protein from transposon X-element [Trichonephila clavipes]
MRKYIFEYVSTCDRCQKFNYKNALPAGPLIPIVSNYPNEIVTLDLLGPYSASRSERYRFLLVITDHFTKWNELIPLRKVSAQAIGNALFENYISRYGAPISLISDNGPQFISEVFEHLSHRLDVKHMKTVTYRLQVNLTERVNRNLIQMIACFVEENHENWGRFLHEFAFALRTSVNETTNKTPAKHSVFDYGKKPLPEEAATSNDQVQNTKSPPVPPSKRPTEEFITDNTAAISELLKLRVAYTAGTRKIAIIPSTRDKYSHFQGELESIYNKLILPETRKRATVDEDGFRLPPKKATANPNGKPFLFYPAAILTHPNSSAPSAPSIILSYEEVEEIELDTEQAAVAPRVKIPPFFIQPNPDWTDLMVFAHSLAPTLQSKLSGRFLRITVQSEEEYRKLATYSRHEQIAFKSFMLKSERPLKLILRGLPTSTELETVKKEIESEGFKIHKISRLTKFQSKSPMPLIYIQLINDLNADSIYNYVDMFVTRVAFEPYDGSRNRRPNQCWRCQGFFHSSEVSHLPMKCLKCAGPHQAKDCILHFEDPLKCANCDGEHAANLR